MTQILNLDDLETPTEKTLVHKGVKHTFVPFSVGAFIDQLKELESFQGQDVPVSEYMGQMVKMVQRAFPSLAEAELLAMSQEKLTAISNFVRGVTQREVAESAAAAEASDGKKETGTSA